MPTYAAGYDVNAKLAGKALGKAEGEVSAEVKKTIVRLQEDMDQDNIALRNSLTAAMRGLDSQPCNPENLNKYYRTLEKLSERTVELRKLNLALATRSEGSPDPTEVAAIAALGDYYAGLAE